MPCSGLNSADERDVLRRRAAGRWSCAPSRARAGVVGDQADALAAQRARSRRRAARRCRSATAHRGGGAGSVPDGAEVAAGHRRVGRKSPAAR